MNGAPTTPPTKAVEPAASRRRRDRIMLGLQVGASVGAIASSTNGSIIWTSVFHVLRVSVINHLAGAECQQLRDLPGEGRAHSSHKVHIMEHPKSVSARKVVQTTGEGAAAGTQSIDRATTLLLLVGRAAPAGARLSELTQQCDLPKPTVRRMLLALVRAGLLEQDAETRKISPRAGSLRTRNAREQALWPASYLSRLSCPNL